MKVVRFGKHSTLLSIEQLGETLQGPWRRHAHRRPSSLLFSRTDVIPVVVTTFRESTPPTFGYAPHTTSTLWNQLNSITRTPLLHPPCYTELLIMDVKRPSCQQMIKIIICPPFFLLVPICILYFQWLDMVCYFIIYWIPTKCAPRVERWFRNNPQYQDPTKQKIKCYDGHLTICRFSMEWTSKLFSNSSFTVSRW